jgi:F0F1-type ATP synthase membrane subunit b/b'
VFLKYYHTEQLNVKLIEFARVITECQRHVRRFVAQRKYAQLKKAANEYKENAAALAEMVQTVNQSVSDMGRRLNEKDAENHKAAEEEKARIAKAASEAKQHEVQTVGLNVKTSACHYLRFMQQKLCGSAYI